MARRQNTFTLDLRPMINLSARVPARLAELIRADAEEDERTPSQVIKRILAQYYDAKERA